MSIPRSCIPCPKIEDDCYDWYERHKAKQLETKTKKADIIFIGDSITHFWSQENDIGYGKEVWAEYFSNRKVINLGFGFDRTQNMLWRLENGEADGQDPKLIVVNAGTNQFSITPNYDGDTPEVAFAGVKMLVETLHNMFPASRIIVMAVFPRLPESIQQKIDKLNALIKEHFSDNSENITVLDISSKLRNPDGSFNASLYKDGCCHPNNAGYRIWADALMPFINNLQPSPPCSSS